MMRVSEVMVGRGEKGGPDMHSCIQQSHMTRDGERRCESAHRKCGTNMWM